MSSDAARQLAIRLEAQEDLYFFSRYLFQRRKGYRWLHNGHHRTVCDALMQVFRGECKRLIINIPPRYSKTELAVVNFVAWAMGKAPDSEFIHVSYATPLARNNSIADGSGSIDSRIVSNVVTGEAVITVAHMGNYETGQYSYNTVTIVHGRGRPVLPAIWLASGAVNTPRLVWNDGYSIGLSVLGYDEGITIVGYAYI